MTGRLTFVCHGATASNRTATIPGDEPLENQAALQTEFLKTSLQRFDRAWVSPMYRAQQTADILGLGAESEAALRECDYGSWAGQSIAALHAAEPDNVALWMTDTQAAPHGGEALSAVIGRVEAWLDRIRGDSGRTIAVTHATVVRAAMVSVLGAPHQAFWGIDVEPLSFVDMSTDGRRWTLRMPGFARRLSRADGANE